MALFEVLDRLNDYAAMAGLEEPPANEQEQSQDADIQADKDKPVLKIPQPAVSSQKGVYNLESSDVSFKQELPSVSTTTTYNNYSNLPSLEEFKKARGYASFEEMAKSLGISKPDIEQAKQSQAKQRAGLRVLSVCCRSYFQCPARQELRYNSGLNRKGYRIDKMDDVSKSNTSMLESRASFVVNFAREAAMQAYKISEKTLEAIVNKKTSKRTEDEQTIYNEYIDNLKDTAKNFNYVKGSVAEIIAKKYRIDIDALNEIFFNEYPNYTETEILNDFKSTLNEWLSEIKQYETPNEKAMYVLSKAFDEFLPNEVRLDEKTVIITDLNGSVLLEKPFDDEEVAQKYCKWAEKYFLDKKGDFVKKARATHLGIALNAKENLLHFLFDETDVIREAKLQNLPDADPELQNGQEVYVASDNGELATVVFLKDGKIRKAGVNSSQITEITETSASAEFENYAKKSAEISSKMLVETAKEAVEQASKMDLVRVDENGVESPKRLSAN